VRADKDRTFAGPEIEYLAACQLTKERSRPYLAGSGSGVTPAARISFSIAATVTGEGL
jgi:hypothetical protein